MKKLLMVLIGCIIMLSVSITSYAAKDETDTYEYEIRDGKAVLIKYATTSNAAHVTVPDEVDGYQVIGLEGTFEQNQHVEEIVLPEGIDFLGANTFLRCRKLRTITLPDSLTVVGDNAFYGCTKINNIVLPKSLERIGSKVFFDCDSIEEFVIPDTNKSLDIGYLFLSGKSLKRIVNDSDMDYDETIYSDPNRNEEEENSTESQYKWYLDEAFTNEAKYLPANSIIYRKDNLNTGENDRNEISKNFLELYKEKILSDTIYAQNINTEEQLMEYIKLKEPTTNIEMECSIEIIYFKKASSRPSLSGNHNGKATILLKAKNKVDLLDASQLTVDVKIKYEEDEIEKAFIDKCKSILSDLKSTGVSMSTVNTGEEAQIYIESLVLKDKDKRLKVKVEIISNLEGASFLFKKAIAGTYQNPEGTNGRFCVRIKAQNTELMNDLGGLSTAGYDEADWAEIPIIATPYKKTSSGSSGGGGSSSGSKSGNKNNSDAIPGNGLTITKSSLTEGTWEQVEGKWKLKTSNNIYANSQWANVDNKWYLFGEDGIMLTDWQKVNGKWYLLGQGGDMLTGWQFHNGKWYYMEASGEMTVGWRWILDKCYYMDANGAMLADTTTPDGYKVNKNGEWVQ